MSYSPQKSRPILGVGLSWFVMAILGVGITLSAQAQINLESFWIRAMPPGQPMTAGYGKIINSSDGPTTILGASVTFADKVEFHETVTVDDAVRMQPMASITLEAGESLTLTPGGAHLMIMGVATMPSEGANVALCVQTTAKEACTKAPVMRQAPATMDMHHHHAH